VKPLRPPSPCYCEPRQAGGEEEGGTGLGNHRDAKPDNVSAAVRGVARIARREDAPRLRVPARRIVEVAGGYSIVIRRLVPLVLAGEEDRGSRIARTHALGATERIRAILGRRAVLRAGELPVVEPKSAPQRSSLPKVHLGTGRFEALVAGESAQGLGWWVKPAFASGERCSVKASCHWSVPPRLGGVAAGEWKALPCLWNFSSHSRSPRICSSPNRLITCVLMKCALRHASCESVLWARESQGVGCAPLASPCRGSDRDVLAVLAEILHGSNYLA